MPLVSPNKKLRKTITTKTLVSIAIFVGTVVLNPLIAKTLALDITPPITSVTQTPSSPNGKAGWYKTSINFILDSMDLESGVKEIDYRFNGGSWQIMPFVDTLNLAPNPSFATASSSPSGVDSWDSSNIDTSGSYTLDSANYAPNFSPNAVKIVSKALLGIWNGINNKLVFAVATPLENMTASAYIKTQAVTGTAYFKIYAIKQDSLGVQTFVPITQSTSISGTTGWTKLNLTFIVTELDAIGVYMDIGLDGPGTVWIDAVNIASTPLPTQTTFNFGIDGTSNQVEYFAVDNAGNIEPHSCSGTIKNCITFKMDQTPPGNWNGSGAIRALFGNNYDLWVYTNITDATSGISTFTDKYQYFTENNPTFGKYSNIFSCSSTWQPEQWFLLISPPFFPGVKSAYLLTPRTSFCNANWRNCKIVRFYAEDMAGNTNTKDLCINGPWIRLRGEGTVGANNRIDMLSEANGDNTDGVIAATGNGVDFFTSTKDWVIKNAPPPTLNTYDDFYTMAKSKSSLGGSDLNTSSGAYTYDGNLTIGSANLPSNFSTTSFNQIVFVSGDLTINNDIVIDPRSTLLFVVKGNVNIAKEAVTVTAAILADGDFSTSYNFVEGEASSALVLKGFYSANKFIFQRTLQGTDNSNVPSEDFVYEPKYLIQLKDYFTTPDQVKWE